MCTIESFWSIYELGQEGLLCGDVVIISKMRFVNGVIDGLIHGKRFHDNGSCSRVGQRRRGKLCSCGSSLATPVSAADAPFGATAPPH